MQLDFFGCTVHISIKLELQLLKLPMMALLQDIVGALPQTWKQRTASTMVVAILFPFLLTWAFTSWQSWRAVSAAAQAAPGNKRPPTLPTTIPLIGHVLRFSRDGHKFLFGAVYVSI